MKALLENGHIEAVYELLEYSVEGETEDCLSTEEIHVRVLAFIKTGSCSLDYARDLLLLLK